MTTSKLSLDELGERVGGPSKWDVPAPVEQWHPECRGDIDLRIARDGRWYYQDTLMTRDALVHLFARILRRDADGEYYLVTPVEKFRLQVDDVPFVIVESERIETDAGSTLRLTSNVGDSVMLTEPEQWRLQADEVNAAQIPYIRMRGALDARVLQTVYYALANAAKTRDQNGVSHLGVLSAGHFFSLGHFEENDAIT